MESPVLISTRFPGKDLWTKIFLICGIFSSLLYIAMNIFVPLLYPGYNSAFQTVSELSAIGTPTRTIWVWLGSVYTLFVIVFGLGVWRSATQNRKLRVVGILLVSYGVVSIIWPFAPMHQREALAAGEKSLTDTIHLVLAIVTVIFMLLAMAVGARAFGKRFRLYSITTILMLLLFGALTALDAPKVEANLPTPMSGVWERINIGVYLIWLIVLAVILLKKVKENHAK